MKKKLKWRLGSLPTPSEVQELVKNEILTKDEAREILFTEETEDTRDKKSLESEIKFLRELVEKLSKNRTTIVETIREIKVPYYNYGWYKPYDSWCTVAGSTGANTATSGLNSIAYTAASGSSGLLQAASNLAQSNQTNASFSSINTF